MRYSLKSGFNPIISHRYRYLVVGVVLFLYAVGGYAEHSASSANYSHEKLFSIDRKIESSRHDFEETPDGPRGRFSVQYRRDLSKKKKKADKYVREKSALNFVLAEKHIFRVSRPEQLNIFVRHDDETGNTNVRYERLVNDLVLDDMEFMVHVGPEGNITYVHGNVAPVSPALRASLKKETISEGQVRELVLADMGVGADTNQNLILGMEKKLESVHPYVTWKVKGFWDYEINAFSGKIISKRQGWQN